MRRSALLALLFAILPLGAGTPPDTPAGPVLLISEDGLGADQFRPDTMPRLWALAQEGRATFVLVEHDMDVVFALSRRVVVLHRGEVLCDGPPERVRGDPRVREVYLGDEVAEAAGGAAP